MLDKTREKEIVEKINSSIVNKKDFYTDFGTQNEYGCSLFYMAITLSHTSLNITTADFKYMLYNVDLSEAVLGDKNYVSSLLQYNQSNNLLLTDADIEYCIKNTDISMEDDNGLNVLGYYLNTVASNRLPCNDSHLDYLIGNTDFNRYIEQAPLSHCLISTFEYHYEVLTDDRIRKIYEATDIEKLLKSLKNMGDDEAYENVLPKMLALVDKMTKDKFPPKAIRIK